MIKNSPENHLVGGFRHILTSAPTSVIVGFSVLAGIEFTDKVSFILSLNK